jgi:hypothetical protein
MKKDHLDDTISDTEQHNCISNETKEWRQYYESNQDMDIKYGNTYASKATMSQVKFIKRLKEFKPELE